MRKNMMRNRINVVSLLIIVLVTAAGRCPAASEFDAPLIPKTHLSDAVLKIWNDPAFQQQFTNSYLAETDIEPRVTEDERDKMLKVLEHISADDIDKAAEMLRKEIDKNEAISPVFYFTLANIHFQREELEPAAELYSAAVKKFDKFRRAWRNLGLIYVRQGEFADAVPALTKVIELGGSDSITFGLLGFAYSSVDNHISAESAYRMAILLDPKTLDWKMGLARSFFKQERFNEAVALCGQLIRRYPDRADLWMLQANAYIGGGQAMKAAEIFEMVDRMGKSSAAGLNTLGDIYINSELYEMATDVYIKAMDKDPRYDPARAIRSAKVLIARGAFAETRRVIEKINTRFAGQLDTEAQKDVLKLRARLAVADGSDEDEEVGVLEQIVELDPTDGEALILLGQHSGRTGATEKAIFYFERAAGIEKFEPDALVRHAQLLVKTGKYDEALKLLRRAQKLKPRDNIQEYLEQVERVAKSR